MEKGAVISEDGKYRYCLWRIWDKSKPTVLFVMLNPSKADADIDDPTIRRCIGFAKSFGYGGIYVGNLFPYRATNPEELLQVGVLALSRDNFKHLQEMGKICCDTIVAWGNNKARKLYCELDYMFLSDSLNTNSFCLGKTKNGYPRHPLYVKHDVVLEKYFEL